MYTRKKYSQLKQFCFKIGKQGNLHKFCSDDRLKGTVVNPAYCALDHLK